MTFSLRSRALISGLSLVLLGCQKPGAPAGRGASDAALEEQREQREQKDPSDPEEITVPQGEPVSFDEELRTVSRLRGLEPKGELKGMRVAEAELLAHVQRSVRLERPAVALRGTEAMLVGLGLVPPDFDFEKTMLGLLSSSLAGLYEPRLKMMLLRDHLGPAEAHVTLLHELVHGLQDQYFDLTEVVEFRDDDSDVSSAVSSLAEGDATSAMLDGILPDGQTALAISEDEIEKQFFSQAPSSTAPPIVIRSLFAPYVDGLRFVNALRRRGGWEEVDEAWRYSPKSTEQILHLDKFDAREVPIAVSLPTAPSADYQLLFHDIWGEQSLRIVLQEWLVAEEAAAAAAGWGGDRIVAFSNENDIVVAWDLRMDTQKDAIELERALQKALSSSPGSTSKAPLGLPPNGTSDAPVLCSSPPSTDVQLAVAREGTLVRVRTAPFDRVKNHSGGCSAAQRWLLADGPQSGL